MCVIIKCLTNKGGWRISKITNPIFSKSDC
nr:MAG TPA: hypothetical protein [Caudoviricetes sp.]